MPLGRLANKVKRKLSPFPSALVDSLAFTVGTKSGNTINVAVQAKSPAVQSLAQRLGLLAYLCSDSAGATLLAEYLMPSGGYAIGTNGAFRHGAQHNEALYAKGTLAIDASAAKYKTTTDALYRASGAQYTYAAATALVFTAAHAVSANKFGVILVQIDKAGAPSTKVSNATQAFTTAPLALAALPLPDAGNVALGYITIAAGGGGFTGNTTALTGISTFVDAPENGQYTPSFTALLNTSSQFDLTFTETRSPRTFYLAVVLPDGSLSVSPAITF